MASYFCSADHWREQTINTKQHILLKLATWSMIIIIKLLLYWFCYLNAKTSFNLQRLTFCNLLINLISHTLSNLIPNKLHDVHTEGSLLRFTDQKITTVLNTNKFYSTISQAIFSEIWTCIDQKHSQQRGSAYSREFDQFFSSLRSWELMEMSRKFCDRLVAKSKSVKHNKL